MITLSKKSWHYRFARFGRYSDEVRSNLCPYVRQIIVGMLKFSGLAFAATAQVIGMILSVAIIWTLGFDALFVIGKSGMPGLALWVMFAVAVTLLAVCLLGVAGFFATKETLYERFRDRYIAKHGREAWDAYRYGEKPAKEPNIITEWFRAKHDKICPQLSFKDGN